ncbi:MAG: hypothetical protein O3B13_20725, partial [Planctomycetota bacterium]|nr:hypothetical protein [Planctomycetota bacterium]
IASALEQTGQASQAADVLNRLLTRRPSDTAMRRRLADLLMASNKPADVQAAQLHFRKLEASFSAGDADWMDARIHVIEIAISLKNVDEARKLLKVTQLLYPPPNDDALKQRLTNVAAALASVKQD